jgi:hypothetical protein
VFTATDFSLKFVTKTIPIKKGNIQIATVPVSAETQDHTTRLLKKLSSASAQKRNIAPSEDPRIMQTMKSPTFMVTTIPAQKSSFTQSSLDDMQEDIIESDMPSTPDAIQHRFTVIEEEIQRGAARMNSIEDLCQSLKIGQDKMNEHLELISRDMYDSPSRFEKFSKLSSS